MGDTEVIRRMCGGKQRFSTKKLAESARDSLQAVELNYISVYQCPYCHCWHMGRKRFLKTDTEAIARDRARYREG